MYSSKIDNTLFGLFSNRNTPLAVRFQVVFGVVILVQVVGQGVAYAGPWDNVDKNVTSTALGHKTAVSCHNCYNGPDPGNDIYNLSDANQKVGTAVNRGADLIELDLNDRGNDEPICVTHIGDGSRCNNGEPLLQHMLNYSTLKNSDAMLFLEVKNPVSNSQNFARKLFDLILDNGNQVYATAGRTLFVRTFYDNISYLSGIRNELFSNSDYSGIRDHVKFSVLFREKYNGVYWGGEGSISGLQDAIRTGVYDNNFDMVEFQYQTKDILGALKYAQYLGLATGIYTVPSSFGEVFVAAMREEVDQITTEYRVDYAQDVIGDVNTLSFANVWFCYPWYYYYNAVIYYNYLGSPGSISRPLFQGPTSSLYGSPGMQWDNVGQDRFGCSLDYRSNQEYNSRALSLGDRDNEASAGFLVTAYVNFDKLSNLPEDTMAILNKSESGGFALELHQSGSNVYLRFGVHVNGGYRYHSYNVHDTNVGGINDSLNGADGYFLIGAYDGNGGVYLWIDNRRNDWGGSYLGGVTRNNAAIMVGADPQPSANMGARYFFDGLIQHVSVQRWDDHPGGTN